MKRSAPLRRNTPLKRSSLQRSKRPKDQYVWSKGKQSAERAAPMQRKTPMRKISKAHDKRLRTEYNPVQRQFLAAPENRYCHLCLCRSTSQHLEDIKLVMGSGIDQSERALMRMGARLVLATEVHHFAGRTGKLLSYTPYFIASCYGCRIWPHDRKAEARKLGLLCEIGKWNSFPERTA